MWLLPHAINKDTMQPLKQNKKRIKKKKLKKKKKLNSYNERNEKKKKKKKKKLNSYNERNENEKKKKKKSRAIGGNVQTTMSIWPHSSLRH